MAVTPQGVVAFWGGHWRLLSPDDGSELARQPAAGDDHEEARVVSVTDGERIYSYAPVSPEEGRLGRRLDDLSLAGTTESPPPGAADDQEVLLAPGRIVVYDGLDDARPGHLVGLGDGPPLDAP